MEPDEMRSGMYLHPLLAEAFTKFPSDAWVRAAERVGVGVALVRSPEEALADPALLADGCVVEVDDPEDGCIRHVGTVLELSATPPSVRGRGTATGRAHRRGARRGRGDLGSHRSRRPAWRRTASTAEAGPSTAYGWSTSGWASPARSRDACSPTSAPT